MLSFIGTILYISVVIIRPQEWLNGLLNQPIEAYLISFTLISFLFEKAGLQKRLVIGPPHIFLVSFLLSIVFSHILNGWLPKAPIIFNKYLKIAVIFFVISNSIDSLVKLKVAIGVFFVSTIFVAVHGIMRINTGFSLVAEELSWGYRLNWIGIFDDSNSTALLFVVNMPIVYSLVWGKVNLFTRTAGLSLFSILFYALSLTSSRGGLLAFSAGAFPFLFKRFNKIIGILIIIIMFVLSLAFMPERMLDTEYKDSSAQSRTGFWEKGMEFFKESPVFGIGKGMFIERVGRAAHNSFIENLSETGIIGLFFWVGLIYYALKGLLLLQQTKGREGVFYANSLADSLLASLVSFFAGSLFVTIDNELLYILVAFCVILFRCSTENDSEKGVLFQNKDIPYIICAEVAGILVMYIAIQRLG